MTSFSRDWRCDWLIQIINYGYCEPAIWRFYGSENEMKAKLVELAEADRKEDEENWCYGTETEEDVEITSPWELFAVGNYDDGEIEYQIEYIATKNSHIDFLK